MEVMKPISEVRVAALLHIRWVLIFGAVNLTLSISARVVNDSTRSV